MQFVLRFKPPPSGDAKVEVSDVSPSWMVNLPPGHQVSSSPSVLPAAPRSPAPPLPAKPGPVLALAAARPAGGVRGRARADPGRAADAAGAAACPERITPPFHQESQTIYHQIWKWL